MSSQWSDSDLRIASEVDIVTLASPSAVRTWTDRVSSMAVAVAIGETTATAAKQAGFAQVFAPAKLSNEGLDDLAALVVQVARDIEKTRM